MNLENMFNSGFTSLDGGSRMSSGMKVYKYKNKNLTPTKSINQKDKIPTRNHALMFGSSVEVNPNLNYPTNLPTQSEICSSSKETFYIRE